jgi:hypothetical protein
VCWLSLNKLSNFSQGQLFLQWLDLMEIITCMQVSLLFYQWIIQIKWMANIITCTEAADEYERHCHPHKWVILPSLQFHFEPEANMSCMPDTINLTNVACIFMRE